MIHRDDPQRGFALLIVLWTLPLLALLGTQLVATSRQHIQLAHNLIDAAALDAGDAPGSMPANGWCCAGGLLSRAPATAAAGGADGDRIAARRCAYRVGVLAARRRLGQQLAISGPA